MSCSLIMNGEQNEHMRIQISLNLDKPLNYKAEGHEAEGRGPLGREAEGLIGLHPCRDTCFWTYNNKLQSFDMRSYRGKYCVDPITCLENLLRSLVSMGNGLSGRGTIMISTLNDDMNNRNNVLVRRIIVDHNSIDIYVRKIIDVPVLTTNGTSGIDVNGGSMNNEFLFKSHNNDTWSWMTGYAKHTIKIDPRNPNNVTVFKKDFVFEFSHVIRCC